MKLDELIALGNQAINEQDWEVAYQYWCDVQTLSPNNNWSKLKLGQILMELGRLHESEALLQDDIVTYPDRPYGYIYLARIAQKQQHWDTAIEKWNTVLSKFPDYEWTFYSFAKFLKQIGERDKAEQYLQIDAVKHPDHIWTHLELVQTALDKRQFKLAQHRIEQFAKQHPNSQKQIAPYKKQLKNLQKKIHISAYFNKSVGKWDLQYRVTIIPDFKCMYVAVPKVATSTIIKNLYYLMHGEQRYLSDELRQSMQGIVQSKSGNADDLARQIIAIINDKDYFKFTFVRHPYGRILSAYLNKIIQDPKEYRRLRPTLGFKIDEDISFIDFLKRIREFDPQKLDGHFAPQWFLLGLNKSIQYDFIGRIENFASDFDYVINRLNHNQPLDTPILSQDGHATNAVHKLKQYYGAAEQALVAEIYEDDFKYLGYGYDLDIV